MCQTPAQLMCQIKTMQLSGDEELDQQIRNWIRWDKCPSTSCQVMDAVRACDWDTLRKRLCTRITFGTAGLRACMRAGFDSMNELVVVQTAQGLAKYLIEQFPDPNDLTERGVVIGFDGRYNSHRFAELTAIVLLGFDIKVGLYKRYVATPMVPYAIQRLQCLAGVMVTASHNPKEDNGYKVFWSNGAQIIPPHDAGIQESILANLVPLGSSWDDSAMCSSNLLYDPYDIVVPPYFDALKKKLSCKFLDFNGRCPIKFTYTAVHGVGHQFVKCGFSRANLAPFVSVSEQQEPDPEFPTTPMPNPEEGKTCLDLAIQTAQKNNCKIILANDPDADRLAVAEVREDGTFKLFSGNELGALLGWWSLEAYKETNNDCDISNCVMIASTVSSKILKSMAAIEGFQFFETLTGFKWIANKAYDEEQAGKNVLFCFEEAIGFMVGTNVLDKDGISAAVQVATMACYLNCRKCMTLQEKLRDIYETYGFHTSVCSYLICKNPPIIQQIFERIRTWDEGKADTYPPSILKGEYEIEHVRDLTTGYDSSTSDKKATLPTSSSSEMITFTFKNGAVITLRTSGTEPKLKYYAEMCGKPEAKNWAKLSCTLQTMVDAVVEELYEPKKNCLQRKKE
ncbi:hypothetical protein KR018_010598 [Drosophila ironensis]|nr:hypothetical protein KR018_010598 [Drosophila ironensis]